MSIESAASEFLDVNPNAVHGQQEDGFRKQLCYRFTGGCLRRGSCVDSGKWERVGLLLV